MEPFAYDTYRQKRIEAKLEEERKSRITLVKKLPKVCVGGCRHGLPCGVTHCLSAHLRSSLRGSRHCL